MMIEIGGQAFRNRDFWICENQQYARPNFRLKKCARLIEQLASGKDRALLDVGCGPAALRTLLPPNIEYSGLDMALHSAAPYLREMDFVAEPISFGSKHFDIIVALGLFEYLGQHQTRKFREINALLRPGGTFVMSYINFRHVVRRVYPAYNNIQTIDELTASLKQVFHVERCFPVSHHWRHKQPGHKIFPEIQMHMNVNIPFFSPRLAVEYFCICRHRQTSTGV